jgi:hypothetical protein
MSLMTPMRRFACLALGASAPNTVRGRIAANAAAPARNSVRVIAVMTSPEYENHPFVEHFSRFRPYGAEE